MKYCMIDKSVIEKKLKTSFKNAEFEVEVKKEGIKISIEGIGEDITTLFEKIGDLVSGLNKISNTKNADVIISIQGVAYGIELEIY